MTIEIETVIGAGGRAISRPGAYRIDEAAYHADPCPRPSLSSSAARLLLDATPLHVWTSHPRLNPDWQPDPPSRRLALGSVVHRLMLGEGPEIVEIEADDYRGKAAKEERDAAFAAGAIPILAAQYAQAEAIAGAAREQLAAHGLGAMARAEGDAEVSILAEYEAAAWMRARLDWWSSDRCLVVDFKTTIGLASADAFVRAIAQHGYDVQAAFYARAIEQIAPELAGRLRFVFGVQEIEPPYALNAVEICEADLHVARRKVDHALGEWQRLLAANQWPAYPPGIACVALPDWHSRRWLDRELEGDTESPDWQLAGGAR